MTSSEHKKENGFNLLHLPFLPMQIVFRFMNCAELIKTALNSERMEYWIMMSRLGGHDYTVSMKNDQASISLNGEKATLTCGGTSCDVEHGFEVISKENLRPWIDGDGSYSIQNTMTVFIKTIALFPCRKLFLMLNLEQIKSSDVDKILEYEQFKFWKQLKVTNGNITRRQLNVIMGSDNSERSLLMKNVTFPADFVHENAFKFSIVLYEDAKWVKVKYLQSLNNCIRVRLENTNYCNTDIRKLVKYWITAKKDMFQHLEIISNCVTGFCIKRIFKNIVRLRTLNHGPYQSFFLADPNSERKRQLGVVSFIQNAFIFSTFSKDDLKLSGETFQEEYDILMGLNERKDLEELLEKLDDDSYLLKRLTKATLLRYPDAQIAIDRAVEKEETVKKQLKELNEKLEVFKLRSAYKNDFYML